MTGVTEEEFAFDFIDEERIRFDWKFIHFCPQYRILCINNKISVSKIIRMEDFSEAWPAFSESVGLAPTLPLHNVGPKIDRSGMSDRLIARLNDLYARDFEIFSYEKVPVEVQAPRGRIQSDYISLWPEYRGCDTSDQTRI